MLWSTSGSSTRSRQRSTCRITCSPSPSRRRPHSGRSSASPRWISCSPSGTRLTASCAGSSTSQPRARGGSVTSGGRSRQAEAEREARARIITADGESQASKRLAAAANVMSRDPAALQLRLLQTVVEVAAEKNSTLVMPVPGELLRFFDRMPPGAQQPAEARPEEPEDLGDAEVAEAEAEIAGVNVPELEESAIPPVPEVGGVTGQGHAL